MAAALLPFVVVFQVLFPAKVQLRTVRVPALTMAPAESSVPLSLRVELPVKVQRSMVAVAVPPELEKAPPDSSAELF